MTAAALRSGVFANRWLLMVAVIALMLTAAAALFDGRRAEARVPTVPTAIAPQRAAVLVEVTGGVAAESLTAVGERARMINAAMPFDAAAVRMLRPFELGGDGLDHRRALLCLTQAVYYEAGFEPLAGRRAVAQVVLNRMRHPAYPKSVCGVVYQKNRTPVCQFSFVCDGSLLRQPSAGAWREARDIAAAALAGFVEPSVGSATHYHADYVAPRWAPMLSKVAKLGAHIFYRWQGSWGLPAAFTGRYIGEPSDPATLRPVLRPSMNSAVGESTLGTIAEAAGPPIARAPNDVGGLLDTSKGWTLNIPLPSDAGSATRAIAEQQRPDSPAPAPAPATAEPGASASALASR